MEWTTPSGSSGITEDDIKEGLTIQSDHEEGDGYTELTLSPDDVYVNAYNGDGNPLAERGFGYSWSYEYSEDNGDTIHTSFGTDINPDSLSFNYAVENQTQQEIVEQKYINITPNFDDNVLEVNFNDDIAETNEIKTVAFVEDLEDELPDYSNASAGDVLAVDSNGDLEWAAPSGGSSYTAGDGINITNDVISTTEKPVRVITTTAINSANYTADDVAYIINAIDNGLDNYPFVIDISNYGNVDRYIPVGRNATQIKMFSIGEKKIYNIGHTANNQLAFSNTPIDGAYLSTRLTAANAPSGIVGNTIDTELSYIKNNYATKAEVPTAAANAATALYLKDANDVVYEITVDTNGNLSATQVSNN